MNILYINSPKYDLITALHIEGLYSIPNLKIKFSSLGNYAKKSDVLNPNDCIDYGKNFADMVIQGSRPLFSRNLINKIQKKYILMEGGDESLIYSNPRDVIDASIIFKREIYQTSNTFQAFKNCLISKKVGLEGDLSSHPLLPHPYFHGQESKGGIRSLAKNILGSIYQRKILPFPLGIEKRFIGKPNLNPKINVSFIMKQHNEMRRNVSKLLSDMNLPGVFIGEISPTKNEKNAMVELGACHPNFADKESVGMGHSTEYYQTISESRACIDVPGGGFGTLRTWEILANGSLLIAKKNSLRMPYPLIEGVHYLPYNNYEDLQQCVKFVFENPEKADLIRMEGYKFALEFHTSSARAEYFLGLADKLY